MIRHVELVNNQWREFFVLGVQKGDINLKEIEEKVDKRGTRIPTCQIKLKNSTLRGESGTNCGEPSFPVEKISPSWKVMTCFLLGIISIALSSTLHQENDMNNLSYFF